MVCNCNTAVWKIVKCSFCLNWSYVFKVQFVLIVFCDLSCRHHICFDLLKVLYWLLLDWWSNVWLLYNITFFYIFLQKFMILVAIKKTFQFEVWFIWLFFTLFPLSVYAYCEFCYTPIQWNCELMFWIGHFIHHVCKSQYPLC